MAKTINIEDFYTEENEKKGMWHEPVVDDKGCGLEFLLIGIHSEEAVKSMEHYDELMESIEDEPDSKEKEQKLKELDADRVASLTKGIRATDGSELMINGEKFKFSQEAVKQLYLNSPFIKLDNIEFTLKSSNFMKKQ